MTTVRSQ